MGATCRPAARRCPLALPPPPPAQTLLCCGHQPAAGYIQLAAMLAGPTCGAYCVLAVVAAAAAMGGLMVLAAAAGAHSTSLRIQAAAYPAFLLLSAAYWLPAARCMYIVGAAMLRCPSLAQLPATLLSPAVLPHVLLYLWGCERWHASALLEWWAASTPDQCMREVVGSMPAYEHRLGDWPFAACCRIISLFTPGVSGAAAPCHRVIQRSSSRGWVHTLLQVSSSSCWAACVIVIGQLRSALIDLRHLCSPQIVPQVTNTPPYPLPGNMCLASACEHASVAAGIHRQGGVWGGGPGCGRTSNRSAAGVQRLLPDASMAAHGACIYWRASEV